MTPLDLHKRYIQQKLAFNSPVFAEPVILYQASEKELASLHPHQKFGIALVIVSIGALIAAIWPFVGLDISYAAINAKVNLAQQFASIFPKKEAPVVQPVSLPEFDPLKDNNDNTIKPVNTDFSLIIPSIGVNAAVIPGVNPASYVGYSDALKKGVAHASTSFYPNENGTVYLFSHSTNYEWFVKDLNAVFYLLKNVKPGDNVVIMYLGDRYTYKIRESKVVSKREVAYLQPQYGVKNLILQTCWPPGTDAQRMLFFADFVEVKHIGNFQQEIDRPTQFSSLLKTATLANR